MFNKNKKDKEILEKMNMKIYTVKTVCTWFTRMAHS